MAKPMSNADYVKLLIQDADKKAYVNESAIQFDKIYSFMPDNEVTQMKREREVNYNKLNNFTESVKISLLSECFYKFFKESLNVGIDSYQNEAIMRSLISNFIQENGAITLLSSFRTKSYVLSEMNRLVNNYYKVIIEAVDKDNVDTFVIDPNLKDEFFKDLSELNSDEAIIVIRSRVTDAMEEFIQSNAENKLQIQTILQDTQEKINASKSDAVKESCERLGKQKINETKLRAQKNVFGYMVQSTSESVFKDEGMRQQYLTENNKIDLDSVVEKCEVMYTFLEMVNTMNIIDINEEYIEAIVKSMK